MARAHGSAVWRVLTTADVGNVTQGQGALEHGGWGGGGGRGLHHRDLCHGDPKAKPSPGTHLGSFPINRPAASHATPTPPPQRPFSCGVIACMVSRMSRLLPQICCQRQQIATEKRVVWSQGWQGFKRTPHRSLRKRMQPSPTRNGTGWHHRAPPGCAKTHQRPTPFGANRLLTSTNPETMEDWQPFCPSPGGPATHSLLQSPLGANVETPSPARFPALPPPATRCIRGFDGPGPRGASRGRTQNATVAMPRVWVAAAGILASDGALGIVFDVMLQSLAQGHVQLGLVNSRTDWCTVTCIDQSRGTCMDWSTVAD